MSFNGLTASFLPFTINGLTDATFSNSNIGNAIATTLQLTSATPLKLARFNADRELVSASVDESQVALLVGNNTFKGSQTILPGTSTNINNVITTAITAEAYTEADFTTSGISGYAAPLGTLSGPIAGEYSIGQTANDRTIMKINGFVPTEKTWVYSFMIRIVDAAEGYLSVEQSGVQRSSTLRLITSELTMVSDTFTYDPTSGDIVFKIYTGSLDPWNASWSSFTLGSYTAAITAPLSAPLIATTISTTTIGTEILAFPSTLSNTEAWSVYSISTMGNPSSLGGLIFQEATLGVGAYITGGVVGATSFRFNTISGDAGKVVVTNGDQVMSTSISAGQLQYITGLTSQAGGIGQTNTWTGANDFTGTTSVAALRITSSVVNADYTLSVNQFDQLEFSNLSNGSIFKTNGSDLFVTGTVNCATLGATNVEAGSNLYLAKGSVAEWRTTLGMSDEYEILDDAGVMRSRLSKTTGLTVSSLTISQVPSATPTLALGLDGSNSVVSFSVPTTSGLVPYTGATSNVNLNSFNLIANTARFTGVVSATPSLALGVDGSGNLNTFTVPSATNILPLNNVFTGTNTFQDTVQVSGVGVNLGVSLGSIIKTTATAGSLVQLTGGGATNSPYLEFFFGGNSRGYLGNASAIDLDLVAQNGAKLNFYTQGTKRMEIATSGDINISAPKFIATSTIANINGGSGFTVNGYMSAGSLTIGDNSKNYGGGVSTWNTNTAGLLMECQANTEIAIHDGGDRVASFMYYSGNTFTMGRDMGWGGGNISMPGIVSITGALTFGYSRFFYPPEIAGATYGSMAVKGSGRNGWAGYSIYNDSSQQVSFMMNNTAQSHGIYNATANSWTLYSDVANGITYLQNRVGNTPISFGPGSWNTGGGGYTLIARELGNNTSALAFGASPGRGVVISLTAGIAWNDLILSGGTIYTSCYGGINNYTNGGGWVYSSDKRVKKDIKDIKTARSLERIMALKPKTYKKIYHPDKSSTTIPQEVIEANHVGFLAQDVMETNPHCVSEWVDDNCVCDGDDGKRLGISYGDINVHMVGAIQELKKQNDAQQKEIDDLKALVQQLLAK